MIKTIEKLIEKTVFLEAKNEALEAQLQAGVKKLQLAKANEEALEAQLQTEIERREFEKQHAIAEYDKLLQAYKESQRARFGAKRERFVEETSDGIQMPLFTPPEGGVEVVSEDKQELSETAPENIEVIAHQRKKKQASKDIPTREEVIAVPEEERVCSCGCQKVVVRYEERERLNFKPAVFERVIEKREVVACPKHCAGSVVTAPVVPHILPKSKASESLLAYVAVSKVLDRQPLYHLEQKILREHEWHISRQTLARWMIQLSDRLQPLINVMKDRVLEYEVSSLDATTLQVLNEPMRAPETKSQAYCIRGGPPGQEVTLFEYNAYSQKDFVAELFSGYRGVIHVDGSTVFDKMAESPDITLSYCHAHARRKFEQIAKSAPKKEGLAKAALRFYHSLYQVEREAKAANLTPEKRYTLRQEKSVPLLAQWKMWLDEHADKTLPKSPIGQAIAYSRTHWEGLQVYLTDGRLEIDNNGTEREIKTFVIARKNFLFSCTPEGADALGIHFSLILTAKNHELDPMAYYTRILKEIPLCQTLQDFEALLPWNLKEALCCP